MILIDKKENRKYGLTAIFRGIEQRFGAKDEISVKIIRKVIIRDNANSSEVAYTPPGSLPAGEFYFTDVWSPNEEYLILPLGMIEGFGVFAAKDALQNIAEDRYLDTIKVGGSTGGWYWHNFERWNGDSTFSFRAGLYGDMFAYKYDVKKSDLSCYRIKCEENDIGKNIKGNIKPIKRGDIETTKKY